MAFMLQETRKRETKKRETGVTDKIICMVFVFLWKKILLI